MKVTRRSFMQHSSLGIAATALPVTRDADELWDVQFAWPRARAPLSFIIDDSTCLVNLAHFAMPQFAEAWPQRKDYQKPWQEWPREIPDSFVRKFGEWCASHHVKGKYSIVPYPACVGWVDRELPGWSRQQLKASLDLVRELMVPNWDIHPELITHTRMINLKTGRPFQEINAHTMENWYPRTDVSVDELASYFAYALQILHNCDLPCEGITTPGGFGNQVKEKLPIAVQQAVQDVYQVEIPHYFKYVRLGNESVLPSLEKSDSGFAVNVPAGTGDWFGGWDGTRVSEPNRYASPDAKSGRMVELIEAGKPAIMLCHWPGLYNNGSETGFQAFQQVITALESRFSNRIHWMKPSEIARYVATQDSLSIVENETGINLQSKFDCPEFTLKLKPKDDSQLALEAMALETMQITNGTTSRSLTRVSNPSELRNDSFLIHDAQLVTCTALKKGQNRIVFSA